MKKATLKIAALSVMALAIAVNVNTANAASQAGSALKNAIKQDVQATRNAVKNDIQTSKANADAKAKADQEARTSAAQAKKAQKIKEIDAQIASLNKEMTAVKNNKNISETERTLKVRSLQRQIDFHTKQKAALQ